MTTTTQFLPKWCQIIPKMSKSSPKGVQSGPIGAKSLSRGSQRMPKGMQRSTKGRQKGTKGSKMEPKWAPKLVENEPKGARGGNRDEASILAPKWAPKPFIYKPIFDPKIRQKMGQKSHRKIRVQKERFWWWIVFLIMLKCMEIQCIFIVFVDCRLLENHSFTTEEQCFFKSDQSNNAGKHN